MFAINQHTEGADLNDGQTLADTIDLSTECLVVVDRLGTPFTRLWCLYEMASMPQEKLCLLPSRDVSADDVSAAIRSVNAERAGCFVASDRDLIHRHIRERHGSFAKFDSFLRLRFLLRPLDFQGEMRALLARAASGGGGGGGGFDCAAVRRRAEAVAEAGRPGLLCVTAGPGEARRAGSCENGNENA